LASLPWLIPASVALALLAVREIELTLHFLI
jgi:hypothetical protein